MKKFWDKYKKIIGGIAFTALCLLVWRIGVEIKLPFVNPPKNSDSGDIFGFLNIFTGDALSSFSIVALGISPYITASIVVQLLQMDIIPQFKEWAEEGEAGKEKLNRWTRYIALFLAFVQGLAIIIGFEVNGGLEYFQYIRNAEINIFTFIYMALVLTAGTAFMLWLSDQITMRGIGNGSSILIAAGIISSFPGMVTSLYDFFLGESSKYRENGQLTQAGIYYALLLLFFILIIVGVVWMEGLMRKIPIQYANRPATSKLIGNQDSNIPIKLNSASVIPVIFASTLLSVPLTIINFASTNAAQNGGEISQWWNIIFSYSQPVGYAIYVILIFVFAFFYSFMQIDPDKMADNLKKQNAFIPGVKPGEATAQYISKVLFKVTLLGATYLTLLASLPIIVGWIFPGLPSSVQIGGTSLMIVVGVAVETIKQIQTAAQSKEYHGFIE